MRFASLGSGSRGNALLVQHEQTLIMLDCGFSAKETQLRLENVGLEAGQLDAIVLTHEHSDHVKGVSVFAARHDIPVYATVGTFRNAGFQHPFSRHEFSAHESFAIKDIELNPFPVPHDAGEPSQFVFSDGRRRLAVLTDSGSVTPYMEQVLNACDAMVLECNYEHQWLQSGEYPWSLIQRISGQYGHLSNDQAVALLQAIDTHRLQHIVAAHLSEKHNSPERVRQHLSTALGCESSWIAVMDQDHGLDWRYIE